MTLDFGRKNKIDSNQNLIPPSMTYRYLYQKTILPVLITVFSILVISVALFYGVPKITKNIREKTSELTAQSLVNKNNDLAEGLAELNEQKQSLKNEYDNYYEKHPLKVQVNDSILKHLREEISELQSELRALEGELNNDALEAKYHVEALLSHIDSIRTPEITVISLEDENSANDAVDSALIYKNDVGEVSFSLHGLATESKALSEFLLAIKECEYVKDAKILSIETHTVSEDQNIYVFEVSITPLVLH